MRKIDKLISIQKANLLTEQIFLENKNNINELSPELRRRASDQAHTDKHMQYMKGNPLKSDSREAQGYKFGNEITNSYYQKTLDNIVKEIKPSYIGKIYKDSKPNDGGRNTEPLIRIYINDGTSNGGNTLEEYEIHKDKFEIKQRAPNFRLPDSSNRKLQVLISKLQENELAYRSSPANIKQPEPEPQPQPEPEPEPEQQAEPEKKGFMSKLFGGRKSVSEENINELSPELKHRATNRAHDDVQKFGGSPETDFYKNPLKQDRRKEQEKTFQNITPEIEAEAKKLGSELPERAETILYKDLTADKPFVNLTFREGLGKFRTYKIFKNRFETNNSTPLPSNISRKLERLISKIQDTELPKMNNPIFENVNIKKILLSESEKTKIISEREKLIIESFAKTFNSIKRIDEEALDGEKIQEDFKSNLKGAAAGAAALAGGLNANAQQAPQAHQKISPGMQIQAPQAANTKADDGKTADPFHTQKSGGDEESKYAQNHTKPIVDMARGQDGKTGKDAIFLYHVPKNQVTNRTIDQDRTTVYLNNFDKQVKGTPEWRDYVARCKALGLQIGAFAPIDTDYEGRDQAAAITNLKEIGSMGNFEGGRGDSAQSRDIQHLPNPNPDPLYDAIKSQGWYTSESNGSLVIGAGDEYVIDDYGNNSYAVKDDSYNKISPKLNSVDELINFIKNYESKKSSGI